MPMPRKNKGNKQRRRRSHHHDHQQGSSSTSSNYSATPPPPTTLPPFDLSRLPRYAPTSYLSPWCSPLRTKAWLALHGLLPCLRTLSTCKCAFTRFGGVVRFHVAGRNYEDGNVVVEARIRCLKDVPRRFEARYHVVFGHFLPYNVDVEVLAYAPVGDDDETAPLGAIIMMFTNPADFGGGSDDDDDEYEVGKPRRVAFPTPKPEQCAGILEDCDEARAAVERPESDVCQAFTND